MYTIYKLIYIYIYSYITDIYIYIIYKYVFVDTVIQWFKDEFDYSHYSAVCHPSYPNRSSAALFARGR